MPRRLEDMTEPELRELMIAQAKQIETVCAVLQVERPLYALLLWNDPKLAQYISNCERADMVKSLREAADRIERRQDVTR